MSVNFWAFLFGTLVWAPLIVYRVWRLVAVDEITELARHWLSALASAFATSSIVG